MAEKMCPVCGNPVKRRGCKYCSYGCAGKARQHYKTCAVCGKQYPSPPSDKTRTCRSEECRRKHRAAITEPRLPDMVEKSLKANEDNPLWIKGSEHHITAHSWVIQSPDGSIYECRNLLQWCREHEALFDGEVMQAHRGLVDAKQTKLGRKKRGSPQWKGWTVLAYDGKKI